MVHEDNYEDSLIRISFPTQRGLQIRDMAVFVGARKDNERGENVYALGKLSPIGGERSLFYLIRRGKTWVFLRRGAKKPDKEFLVSNVTVL